MHIAAGGNSRPTILPTHLSSTEDEGILVVVPTLNEAGGIRSLLAWLLSEICGLDAVIVVSDGGSTDGTIDVVASLAHSDPRIRLLFNPARVQSAGINLAVQNFGSGRKWLVRIDAHAEYPNHYLRMLVAEAEQTGAQAVVVSMISKGGGLFQAAAAAAQNSIIGTGNSAHRRGGKAEFVDHGHHALIVLDAFRNIGGYDVTLSHNEDAEFDVRLAKADGKIWLTRAQSITYIPRSGPSALFRQYYNYGRGRARTITKHKLRPRLRQIVPAGVAPACLMLLLLPLHPLFAVPAILWIVGSVSTGVALGLRKPDPASFLSGVAALIMHLGWSIGFWAEFGLSAGQQMRRAMIAAVPRWGSVGAE